MAAADLSGPCAELAFAERRAGQAGLEETLHPGRGVVPHREARALVPVRARWWRSHGEPAPAAEITRESVEAPR
jgi:hypothetical protein